MRRSHVGSGPCSGRCRGFCGGGCALDLVFGVMKTPRVVSPRMGPCSVDAADSVAAVVPSPAARERLREGRGATQRVVSPPGMSLTGAGSPAAGQVYKSTV